LTEELTDQGGKPPEIEEGEEKDQGISLQGETIGDGENVRCSNW